MYDTFSQVGNKKIWQNESNYVCKYVIENGFPQNSIGFYLIQVPATFQIYRQENVLSKICQKLTKIPII